MGVLEAIGSALKIFGNLSKVFPDWWKKRQAKKDAELRSERTSLKLKRTSIRRQLKNAKTKKERDKLNEIYDNINNRILHINRLLRED